MVRCGGDGGEFWGFGYGLMGIGWEGGNRLNTASGFAEERERMLHPCLLSLVL